MLMSMRFVRPGLALVSMALAAAAIDARPAAEIHALVTYVTDGDSLWVQPAAPTAAIEVRLVDIDAPEICQEWGVQSRNALKAIVQGRSVTLQPVAHDHYGRTLARVIVDGVNVNERLVQEGHAWSTRGRWDRGPLMKDERMARALRRGLHAQPGAVMPRDFRRTHGSCHAEHAVAIPASGASAAYRCDSRTRCAQMTSCAEATFFTQSCPGVTMDGNHDGVPCEKQWCRP